MLKNFKKVLSMLVVLSFMFLLSGDVKVIADETIATSERLIVFKIGDKNYYTQEIGKTAVKRTAIDTAPVIKASSR